MDSNPAMCMAYTKYTRHISERVNLVINDDKLKIHQIDCCEVGLQLADIANKNVGYNYSNTIMKYITLDLNSWYRILVQEGGQDIG